MPETTPKIYYTLTDEAPALATHSLLPIIRSFTRTCGVQIELADISLAARIIANFPEKLSADQLRADTLLELGRLAKTPEANIIKLPNISASIPQLVAAIHELQKHGYQIPDFPEEPETQEEIDIRGRYAKVLGSAVNPVLREGNSDRRVAAPVKNFARQNPHSMGDWASDSQTHVASMNDGDFYSSEQSHIMESAGDVRIELVPTDGPIVVLRERVPLQEAEVIDAASLNCKALRQFFATQVEEAKRENVLFSLHLKATMMKVSDPILFGHAVSVFYGDVLEKHSAELDEIGFHPNNGIGDLYAKMTSLPAAKQDQIRSDIEENYTRCPSLAMVDSDNGITNLHVPSDVIIDASMPAAIRASGKMWGPDGTLHDTKAVIPDRCYAGVYQAVIDFCKVNGAFDVKTMGNVANVGLMAQKAEEYGSHDKTFEIPVDGIVQVMDENNVVLLQHSVEQGDIWRMCQTKDEPIRDWVRLAVARARATGSMAIFWLDENRPHDSNLIQKLNTYLLDHNTRDLEIKILAPIEAAQLSCQRCHEGKDTISVTGNVLRDYLTDLFPILELGTSAKMLSIVPLLAGGGLYETGAGGSAPKHVHQFIEEGHLRWDSLGEFLALAVSLEDLAHQTGLQKITVIAQALDVANEKYLLENKSPSRKVNQIDNRGSHFYLALYWSQALANQSEDPELKSHFEQLATSLLENESQIIMELNSAQGSSVDLGGYYQPDPMLSEKAMRPSSTFNQLIDQQSE
jgi:isocitrate dehydrogenase